MDTEKVIIRTKDGKIINNLSVKFAQVPSENLDGLRANIVTKIGTQAILIFLFDQDYFHESVTIENLKDWDFIFSSCELCEEPHNMGSFQLS